MKSVLDIFSGAGGLSHGFKLAGFTLQTAIDNWGDALTTFGRNNPESQVILADLSDRKGLRAVLRDIPSPSIIVGGPPCQGFSIAGKRDPQDPRNLLYGAFVSTVEQFKPEAFVMENVPTISSPTNSELFSSILGDFEKLGYSVSSSTLLASDYGVPQNRRRMFIVGLLGDNRRFDFPRPQGDKVTVAEALSDLPEHGLEDGAAYDLEPRSEYQALMRKLSNGIYNHQVTLHNDRTKHIISLVPDGGNYKSLPQELQNTRKVNIAWTRLSSSKPSFTVDTGHRHHFHYEYNRVPTVRESARLQSFEDSFVFLGSRTSQMRQVGNAVPPLLARAIAIEIWNAVGLPIRS